MIPFKILLVHNRFRPKEAVTYLSWFIRLVTFSKWNHIAVSVLLHGEWYVVESVGSGVNMKPYRVWQSHSDRIVKEKLPGFELTDHQFHILMALIGMPYGFLDLPKVYLISLYYRLMGKEYTGKVTNRRGLVCSELGALLLGKQWTLVPADFDYLPELRDGEEYETFKR